MNKSYKIPKTPKAHLDTLLNNLPKPVVEHIQHLERIRQDFVANVSHELRTPLTVIHGYLEMLLTHETHPHFIKICHQMFTQTTRMQNLIADLLLLSSLEADEFDVHLKTQFTRQINVAKLLKLIVSEAHALSKNKHDILLYVDKNLCLKGRTSELRTLFSNLIFNAVKYTPQGGTIEIHWKTQRNLAVFCVKDSGIGIAKQHLPRLTERFYRVDKARSRESGGTGLGLAIAKHILIRHGGELLIQSKVGKGSEFKCLFPIKTKHHSKQRSEIL